MPIGGGEKFRHGADTKAEAGMPNGHIEAAVGDNPRRRGKRRAVIHRVAERAASKNRIGSEIEIAAAKHREARRIRGERVNHVRGRGHIDAAHTV